MIGLPPGASRSARLTSKQWIASGRTLFAWSLYVFGDSPVCISAARVYDVKVGDGEQATAAYAVRRNAWLAKPAHR